MTPDSPDAQNKTGIDVTSIDIKTLIPHREPFLMVDRIAEYRPGKGLTAIKAVSRADPWMQGHFPDFALMPGVLVVEALAQTCAVYMALEANGTPMHAQGQVAVLLRMQVRCIAPALPGMLLNLTVAPREIRGQFVDIFVCATQGDRTCVRGVLTVGTAPRRNLEQA
ncbi:MAG: beta-hydroxyacyl-ACP dehydratase [Cupriavidus sp.]|nr:beta-hydroxyacyl-ACP dehydratase [Cupriavidus sp.]